MKTGVIDDNISDIIFSADNYRDFVTLVKKYPVGNNESNLALLEEYQDGNMEARNLLILTNLRLVISVAKTQIASSGYELLDTIHEGIIGLITAVDNFDFDKNNGFSSYALSCIKNSIIEGHVENGQMIKIPRYLLAAFKRHRILSEEYMSRGENLPNDIEFAKILGISKDAFTYVKSMYNYRPESLNVRVFDDIPLECGDLLVSSDSRVEAYLSNIDKKSSIIPFIKRTLPSYYYYIIYSRFISKNPKTLEELASEFGICNQGISKASKRAIRIIKEKLRTYGNLERSSEYEDYSIHPVAPYNLVKYFFFRDVLDEDENDLYWLIMSSSYKHDIEIYSRVLGWDIEYLKEVLARLKEKTDLSNPKVYELFLEFRDNFISKYKTKIYKLSRDVSLGDIEDNARSIINMWNGLSYSSAIELINKEGMVVSGEMDRLLREFFEEDSNLEYYSGAALEREVNSVLMERGKMDSLWRAKLYETLLENRDAFTEEQVEFLMAYKFGKTKKRSFLRKFPDSTLLNNHGADVMSRLEMLYFNVGNYGELNFTKDKYEMVRDLCLENMGIERMELLDKFYGVNSIKYSLEAIAKQIGISYDEVRTRVKTARDSALGLYLNKGNTKTIDRTLYIPFLNGDVPFNQEMKHILEKFLVEEKGYEEIAKELGLSKKRVNALVLEGLIKIDFYRFDIVRKRGRDEVFVLDDVSFQDIEREVLAHPVENVLNPNERLVLACLYGIKCDSNKAGRTFSQKEFRDSYPHLSEHFKKLYKSALETVSRAKMGIERGSISYMKREELRFSLLDPRIPISSKERKILYQAYGLNGYEYKTLEEIARIYDENVSSIKRRIQRAIVTIKKYENLEIPPMISYEYDVLPFSKFFSKADRKILLEKYGQNLTIGQIASSNGLTENQVETLTFRLDSLLKDLLDEKVHGFDFDYFYQVVDNDDIPFYGNKDEAKRIFFLHFEKRMSFEEIKEELLLSASSSSLRKKMNALMLAVLKYREGMRPDSLVNFDDVKDFYIQNKDDMTTNQLETYSNYFKRCNIIDGEVLNNANIGSVIEYDILKAKGELMFDLDKATREEVVSILLSHRNELSTKAINTLKRRFKISSREFMNGSDQRKVIRFLSRIDVKAKILTLKKVA